MQAGGVDDIEVIVTLGEGVTEWGCRRADDKAGE